MLRFLLVLDLSPVFGSLIIAVSFPPRMQSVPVLPPELWHKILSQSGPLSLCLLLGLELRRVAAVRIQNVFRTVFVMQSDLHNGDHLKVMRRWNAFPVSPKWEFGTVHTFLFPESSSLCTMTGLKTILIQNDMGRKIYLFLPLDNAILRHVSQIG